MTAQPEFSRTVRIDTIGAGPRQIEVEADAGERAALARRFDLLAIDRLRARVELVRTGDVIRATGTLEAAVTQSCVATDVPVDASVDEPFQILFGPPPAPTGKGEEEIELSEAECDTVFYTGSEIDIGEAVADSLSLSLDPWPRAPGADEILREAGVKREEEAGPFSALAALRDKLK